MLQMDRAKVGKVMHYCYYAQEIIKICEHKFIEDEQLKKVKYQLELMGFVGIIIVILELDAFEVIESNISALTRFVKKEIKALQSE